MNLEKDLIQKIQTLHDRRGCDMLRSLKVGDKVFVVHQKGRYSTEVRTEWCEITKVGKKYGYITRYSHQIPFNLEDGVSHHKETNERANGQGFDVFLCKEDYDKYMFDNAEYKRLKERLLNRWGKLVELSPDAVAELHKVLDTVVIYLRSISRTGRYRSLMRSYHMMSLMKGS